MIATSLILIQNMMITTKKSKSIQAKGAKIIIRENFIT